MIELEELQKQIECSRTDVNNALSENCEISECYKMSLQLDLLIEEYINLTEATEKI